jgi:hypothetical protein
MHHDGIGLGMGQFLGVQAETVEIFALGRDEGPVHPFFLKAEHHHHVHILQAFGHVVIDLDPPIPGPGGDQRRRSDQTHAVFHPAQKEDVGACHAAMGDVPADRDVEPVDAPLGAFDRQRIEQGLRGVFVLAVARVQDGAIHLVGQKLDRAGMGMAHDQQVGVHRVQRQRRVDQRLALFERTGGHRHVHHIRAQPLARDLEACLRAGRGLEKHVDLGQALERLAVLAAAALGLGMDIGPVEQHRDLHRVEVFDPQEMRLAEFHRAAPVPCACLRL